MFSRVWKPLPYSPGVQGFIKTNVNVRELFLPCPGHHVGMKLAETGVQGLSIKKVRFLLLLPSHIST